MVKLLAQSPILLRVQVPITQLLFHQILEATHSPHRLEFLRVALVHRITQLLMQPSRIQLQKQHNQFFGALQPLIKPQHSQLHGPRLLVSEQLLTQLPRLALLTAPLSLRN